MKCKLDLEEFSVESKIKTLERQIEESYRRGFMHGFGIGSDHPEMAKKRIPTWEEVKKWRYDGPYDTHSFPPGAH